jgi:hypothetical protein
MTKVFVTDQEAVQAVEIAYIEYMNTLYESIDDETIEPEPITEEPFCGCDTCDRRETFAFIFRAFADLLKINAIEIEYEEK